MLFLNKHIKMKKIIVLLLLLSSLSCKKEWFDYTNKYTGNFEFTTESSYLDTSTGLHNYKKTTYNGSIKRIKRGKIKITYGGGAKDFYEVEVDKKGEISGSIYGRFSDENNLSIGNSSGAWGHGSSFSIVGVRR